MPSETITPDDLKPAAAQTTSTKTCHDLDDTPPYGDSLRPSEDDDSLYGYPVSATQNKFCDGERGLGNLLSPRPSTSPSDKSDLTIRPGGETGIPQEPAKKLRLPEEDLKALCAARKGLVHAAIQAKKKASNLKAVEMRAYCFVWDADFNSGYEDLVKPKDCSRTSPFADF